jgi:GPN-loop GTPase
MKDFDSFEDSLTSDKSYLSTLSRSMSLVLQEFYENLNCCGVSAITGSGFDSLLKSIDKGVEEYCEVFLPEIKQRIQLNDAQRKMIEAKNLASFQKDKDEEDAAKPKQNEPVDIENLYNDFDALLKDVNN